MNNDRINDLIQGVNKVILDKEVTVGEYLTLLHIFLTKALSENTPKIEKAFIANLKKETRRKRNARKSTVS